MHEQGQAPDPHAVQQAAEGFNASDVIIGHVSNSSPDHPLIHLPPIFGIDLSVTKHVFMLWLVAAVLFVVITLVVRRSIRRNSLVPTHGVGVLETFVEFVRDDVAKPQLGGKGTAVWLPFLLTLFFFILGANLIGLIPIFDVLGLFNHFVLHSAPDSFVAGLLHGGSTATANYNVTAALAVISFVAIVVAGTKTHGFVKHWMNLVPHGLAWPLYILLIPLEIISLFVRPFALTMRLAANMMGGHIAILAIMSFVFIFTELVGTWVAGVGIGLFVSVPLSVGITGLEIIVVLVQAYVFTLLSAVFMGMAIHAHH